MGDHGAELREAVSGALEEFRKRAWLHQSAPGFELVGFAFGAGSERPGAQALRAAATAYSEELGWDYYGVGVGGPECSDHDFEVDEDGAAQICWKCGERDLLAFPYRPRPIRAGQEVLSLGAWVDRQEGPG